MRLTILFEVKRLFLVIDLSTPTKELLMSLNGMSYRGKSSIVTLKFLSTLIISKKPLS